MKVKSDLIQNPLWKVQTGGPRPALPPEKFDPPRKDLSVFVRPATTHGEYKATLRGLPDQMLEAERARLQAKIRDASTGPLTDPKAVARAKAELAEVEEELKARDGFGTAKDPAYARAMHGKSTPEVMAELAKEAERLSEASTGLSTDPAAAEQARARITMLQQELRGRVMDAFQGKLPEDPPTEKMGLLSKLGYMFQVERMSPDQLSAEKAKQEGILRDATSGPHADPVAADNARERLEIISRKEARLAAQPQSIESYRDGLRGMSDSALAAERARLEKVRRDASAGAGKDPEAAALAQKKLEQLDLEQKTREQLAAGPQPAYAREAHGLSDAELQREAMKQQERLREASTGLSQDPVAAKDAAEKLQLLMREQVRRFGDHFAGNLPVDPPTKPITDRQLKDLGVSLRDDSAAELASTRARLEREVRDASSGAHVDPARAENATRQLEVVKKEEELRAALAKGPQPEYALEVHGNSDLANLVEVARQRERLREATTGLFQDPAAAKDAQEKLRILEAERARRNPLDLIAFAKAAVPVLG